MLFTDSTPVTESNKPYLKKFIEDHGAHYRNEDGRNDLIFVGIEYHNTTTKETRIVWEPAGCFEAVKELLGY